MEQIIMGETCEPGTPESAAKLQRVQSEGTRRLRAIAEDILLRTEDGEHAISYSLAVRFPEKHAPDTFHAASGDSDTVLEHMALLQSIILTTKLEGGAFTKRDGLLGLAILPRLTRFVDSKQYGPKLTELLVASVVAVKHESEGGDTD